MTFINSEIERFLEQLEKLSDPLMQKKKIGEKRSFISYFNIKQHHTALPKKHQQNYLWVENLELKSQHSQKMNQNS